jgi:hypothetical protein
VTPAQEAVFLLATVRYLLYTDRIMALTDMGPLARNSCIWDAGMRWDRARVPWRLELTAG